jgi:type IV secretory pathway ATPase VirB11/archaellum biosynthesis ATPase
MNIKIDKEDKIKVIEEARELVFQLSETQDRIFTNLTKMIGEEFNSDDPLWDYVYNGGEYAKKLFINNLK